LLKRYRELPSEKSKKQLKQAIKIFREEVNKFEEGLRQKVEDLLSNHQYSHKFDEKVDIRGGCLAIIGDLDFTHSTDIYVPSVIDTVEGSLLLHGLESVEGLSLPAIVEGDLDLRSLESAEGLELPDIVEGYLNLAGLESAEGLSLPDTVEGSLYLHGLESAEGLKLHNGIDGKINLHGLSETEREGLRGEYPALAGQITTW